LKAIINNIPAFVLAFLAYSTTITFGFSTTAAITVDFTSHPTYLVPLYYLESQSEAFLP